MNDAVWITSDEWLNVARGDPELELIAECDPYVVGWLRDSSDSGTYFEWHGGNIYTKNPTKQAIMKMEELARRLRAKVQGDDGEVYRNGEVAADDSA